MLPACCVSSKILLGLICFPLIQSFCDLVVVCIRCEGSIILLLVIRHNSLERCCICNVAVLKAFHVCVYVSVLCMTFWTFTIDYILNSCFALHEGLRLGARLCGSL